MKTMVIPATAERQRLIRGIVKSLKSKEPNNNLIEYSYTLERKKRGSSYSSEEQNGIFRDISILHINYSTTLFREIIAMIGNKTGRVFFEKKPVFMSAKKALKKIDEFLRELQPDNLRNSKYEIPSEKGPISGVDTQRNLIFDGYKITQHTESKKSLEQGGPKEVNPLFAKL